MNLSKSTDIVKQKNPPVSYVNSGYESEHHFRQGSPRGGKRQDAAFCVSGRPVGEPPCGLPPLPTESPLGENGVFDNIYTLKPFLRSRVPGEDDGAALPLSDPAWWEADPWADLGQQEFVGLGPVSPYPDLYACNGGVAENDVQDDGEEEGEAVKGLSREDQYNRELGRSNACRKTSALMSTDDFEDYLHQLDCRKAWCPECGGRGGRVHVSRRKAIRKRVDLKKKNLRYFVFTVPEKDRALFRSRHGLNQLFTGAKNSLKKYFGKDAAMVGSMHLYGDNDKGKFNPHVNVLISEEMFLKLKIAPELLGKIKKTWARSLTGMGCTGVTENVFYEFRIKPAHKGHCVKYVSRPTWDADTLDLVDDEEKQFLVLDLKGFQYIRFWGALSNRKYRECTANTIQEAVEEAEAIIRKKLHFRTVVPCNVELMLAAGHLEKVGDGFYRILKGVHDGKGEAAGKVGQVGF